MKEPPFHPNCRCSLLVITFDWRVEIVNLLNQYIGDTDPVLRPKGTTVCVS